MNCSSTLGHLPLFDRNSLDLQSVKLQKTVRDSISNVKADAGQIPTTERSTTWTPASQTAKARSLVAAEDPETDRLLIESNVIKLVVV